MAIHFYHPFTFARRDDSDISALRKNSILEKRQEGTDKSVSVWYRPAKNMPLHDLHGVVSLNAAMTFSEVWKKQLERSPDCKMVEVMGVNKKAYKRLLHWIDLCIDEGNDVKFPDVSRIRPKPTRFMCMAAPHSFQCPSHSNGSLVNSKA